MFYSYEKIKPSTATYYCVNVSKTQFNVKKYDFRPLTICITPTAENKQALNLD